MAQLWKQVNFRRLTYSQSIHAVATIFLQVAVMVEVYQQTNSVFGASAVVGVMSLASFVGGMWAARAINQYKLVSVLVSTSVVRGGLTVLIGVLLVVDSGMSLIGLYVVLAIYSLIAAWYQPARFAALPLIVERDQYIRANSILVTIQQTVMTSGWALGGVAILLLPFPWMIALIASLFVGAGVIARMITLEETLELRERTRGAWRKVWTNPVVRNITLMEIVEGAANAIWTSALLLSFTYVVLGADTDVWGLINAFYFAGAIIGSVIVGLRADLLQQRIGVIIGCSSLAMASLTLVFSLNTIVWITLALCVLMGPMYQARDIAQVSLLQTAIPDKERASVMAARMSFLTPWNGLMVMAVGAAADLIGIQTVYLSAAILYGVGAIIAFTSTSLRKIEGTASKEAG